MGIRVTQDAEAGPFDLLDIAKFGAALEFVLAQAQESEIVIEQPLQEGDGFGEFLDRHRWRIALIGGHDIAHFGLHGAPVENRGADILKNFPETLQQDVAIALGGNAVNMNLDHALANGVGSVFALGDDVLEGTVAFAHDIEDRVKDEQDFVSFLGQQAQRGVDQKGHVVIDQLDDRDVGQLAVLGFGIVNPDDRPAGLALFQEGQAVGCQAEKFVIVEDFQVFRHRALKKLLRQRVEHAVLVG